jgi:uncharacterized protein (TIGR03437 family)
MGGIGAHAGATGPAGGIRLTLALTATNPLTYSLNLAGSATVGSQTLNLAITNVQVIEVTAVANVFDTETGTAVFTPFGNSTVRVQSWPDSNRWDENVRFVEVLVNFTFSPSDSVQAFLIFDAKTERAGPITIVGGTGAYAGASGTAMVTDIREEGDNGIIVISGSLTRAGPTTPIITSVNTASGLNPFAQNTWIEIKGTNLVPRTAPAGGMFWSNAPEFSQGRMPTDLGGVGVTVNGRPAHVWWFCSAATTPSCPTDQINVLTPLDDYLGRVMIVVKNGSESSAPIVRFKNSATPSFLLFHPKGNAVATHANGSLLGPASLFPGASTPARRGETISLWGVGFGLPTTALVAGSSTQQGSLPKAPACSLGGSPVQVAAALVSPGLYQFNVTVQENAAAGEHHFYCVYDGALTPSVLVAVQ